MRIEIARHERMAESGSSLLKLMQNNDTPRLDLLVRESIQNSLDAGDKKSEKVRVDFQTGIFQTESISKYFEGISNELNKRFPGGNSYIAIKDSNTTGLTGPIRYDDVKDNQFGNFLKLVYEISKPQEQSGSGGSWGLGKTVYFRIGIGMVIYYSRVFDKKSNRYESRLAAAFVEDEHSKNTMLPENTATKRGIAWWGQNDPENPDSYQTIPVTDEYKINVFLERFDIKPFGDEETGTTIIIPYVDRNKLLKEIQPAEGEEDQVIQNVPYWCKTKIEDYLKVSFQRWYAPRINNRNYNGQYLEISLNGDKLESSEMAPIFRLIQSLYNSRPKLEKSFNDKEIISKEIEIRRVFGRGAVSGWINYTKVDSMDLQMVPPNNLPSPYYYINKLSSDAIYNDPIVLYTRKPGMVVSYETTGDWTDNIPKTADGEFIVAIFVANSDNILTQNDISFEEYLRRCERADHMSWEDHTNEGVNPQIISRIKKHVRKKIKEDYTVISKDTEEKENLGLERILGDALLPPAGFTYWDSATGGSRGIGGTGGDSAKPATQKRLSLVNRSPHATIKQNGALLFKNDGIEIPVQISFGMKDKVCIEMRVDSEMGDIVGNDWENRIGHPFPIVVKAFIFERAFYGKGKKCKTILEKEQIYKDKGNFGGVLIEFNKTEEYGICNGFTLNAPNPDYYIIEGRIQCEMNNVQGRLHLKEGDN